MPQLLQNCAFVPAPSAAPHAPPRPASVLTKYDVEPQKGAVESPGSVHAEAHGHGTGGAPAAQKKPTGHGVVVFVAPSRQAAPARQGRHAAALVAPGAALYVPPAHAVALDASAGQKAPAGQGVGLVALGGQRDPAGQGVDAHDGSAQ